MENFNSFTGEIKDVFDIKSFTLMGEFCTTIQKINLWPNYIGLDRITTPFVTSDNFVFCLLFLTFRELIY